MTGPFPWPATLTFFAEHGSWQEGIEPNVVDFQVDVGPPKLRRRSYLPSTRLQFHRIISSEDLQTFIDWFEGTLKSGVYTFTATDPRTRQETEYQFTQVPGWRDVATNDDTSLWRLQFSLRRMNITPSTG